MGTLRQAKTFLTGSCLLVQYERIRFESATPESSCAPKRRRLE